MNSSFFFQDLALLMTVAGVVSVVCGKLRWPKVIGYIAAGMLLGKFTWGGGLLADEQSVSTIGELGVVFLMFSMGLGFSTTQLNRIKSVALPVALVDTIVMTWLGYVIGQYVFGWGMLASLFFGVAICDSATTMLAKVIDEMKWGSKPFVRLALGSSVCEDIICVGLIAVITGVAKGDGISILGAGKSLGGLFVFFLAVLVFGLAFVPRLLKSIGKTKDDEALLLTILGQCFFVSWLAYRFDFSLAIGAFLVGIVGAASEVRDRIADMADPLKSMFASVFFVSIGLLIDPMAYWHHLPAILLVSAIVVVGKFINCSIVGLLTGQSVKTSVQMGLSLAQIGEFGFMVAMLYLGCTGDNTTPMFDITIAVSVLTTLLNPLLIKWSDPVGEWIERRIPTRSRSGIETYRGFVAKFFAYEREATLHKRVKSCFAQLALVAILNFAVSICCTLLYGRDWSNFSVFFDSHKKLVFYLLANLFVVVMFVPVLSIAKVLGRTMATMLVGRENTKFQQLMRPVVAQTVALGVLVLFGCEMLMITVSLKPDELWVQIVVIGVLLLAAVFGWSIMTKAVTRASTRFSEALSADERRERIGEMLTFTVPENDAARLTLDSSSPAVGETIGQMNVRAKTGASVVSIERGGTVLRSIGPDTEFHVGDTIVAVGAQHQIAALKDLLGIVN